MRNEQEMYGLIINTAREDERIRAVYMNGSRTNPNAPRDIFQDYDIVYVVEDTAPFREDRSWIDRFGKRLYMQCPEENDRLLGKDGDIEHCYGWLIQFADGNRLDLHVQTIEESKRWILEDKLCRILLDKDGLLPPIPESTDEDYYVRRPSEAEFLACCNEFWWCLNNVAKGLWRREIPYVQDMLNLYIRPELVKVLGWKAGLSHDFQISAGKSGKYLFRYLPEDVWKRFLSTYAGANTEEIWEAVMTLCELFNEQAGETAAGLGYEYCREEASASWGHLKHVRCLPGDAQEIYAGPSGGADRGCRIEH